MDWVWTESSTSCRSTSRLAVQDPPRSRGRCFRQRCTHSARCTRWRRVRSASSQMDWVWIESSTSCHSTSRLAVRTRKEGKKFRRPCTKWVTCRTRRRRQRRWSRVGRGAWAGSSTSCHSIPRPGGRSRSARQPCKPCGRCTTRLRAQQRSSRVGRGAWAGSSTSCHSISRPGGRRRSLVPTPQRLCTHSARCTR